MEGLTRTFWRDVQKRIAAVVCCLIAIGNCFALQALATETPSQQTGTPAASDPATDPLDELFPLDGDAADDLDTLLNLADQDLNSVSRINVSAPSLNMEVTTVTRQKSTVGRSAAAVFVITQEMIRRSGALNVPEVLRLAPGVNVARMDQSRWAISIRGFNGLYSNKLLVQIDGRTTYTPLFGGIYWNTQETMLADIERIEVIRGPGATVWGANAVNGIINIITKHASDTVGTYADVSTGTLYNGVTNVRHGVDLGEGKFFRLYGRWLDHDRGFHEHGLAHDDWRHLQGGFRFDWDIDPCNQLTIQGDIYRNRSGRSNILSNPLSTPPTFFTYGDDMFHGGNALARWTHQISEDSEYVVQLYYDEQTLDSTNSVIPVGYKNTIKTYDIDFQHHFHLNDWNEITWGLGYRHIDNNVRDFPGLIIYSPSHRSLERFSAFLQDRIILEEDRWELFLGTKISHNTFSDFEFQPSARLLFLPDDRHSVWAGISRAVRTPTISESDSTITLPPTTTTPPFLFPHAIPQDRDSQDLLAYEMGMRGQPVDDISWDVALFHHRYTDRHLSDITGTSPVPGNPLALFLNIPRVTGARVETYGAEISGSVQASRRTLVRGTYSMLYAFGQDASGINAPINQATLTSSTDLTDRLFLDATWRYVDNIPGLARHYDVVDLRLAWQPTENLEWSFVGRNLFSPAHLEFKTDEFNTFQTGIRPEFYTTLSWSY